MRQNQFIGSTGEPFCSTVKCRWQPVDQPVVPTYPMTWPRSTCWPDADGVAVQVVGDRGQADAVVEAVVDDHPVAPGGLEVALASRVPEAAARIGVPQAAPKSMPSCSER